MGFASLPCVFPCWPRAASKREEASPLPRPPVRSQPQCQELWLAVWLLQGHPWCGWSPSHCLTDTLTLPVSSLAATAVSRGRPTCDSLQLFQHGHLGLPGPSQSYLWLLTSSACFSFCWLVSAWSSEPRNCHPGEVSRIPLQRSFQLGSLTLCTPMEGWEVMRPSPEYPAPTTCCL